jgi:hypothetical protein
MMDAVTSEYCCLSVVHFDWYGDHERPARMPEPFVKTLL